LKKLQRKEAAICQKLYATDSIKAKEGLNGSTQFYTQLLTKYNSPEGNLPTLSNYLPALDSLQSVTAGIKKFGNQLNEIPADKLEAVNSLNGAVRRLQGRMQNAADIKSLVRARKEQWKQELNKAFEKEFLSFNKTAYYYQAQLAEYRSMLREPDKLVSKLLSVAREQPFFKDMMGRNSWLSQMFPAPLGMNAANTSMQLAGLQTSNQVQQLIGQQMGLPAGTRVNPQQFVQQQSQTALLQLNQLKDKVNKLGEGSSDFIIPDFKPNNQKSKSFLKRLEYSLSFQSQKQIHYCQELLISFLLPVIN